MAKKKKSFFEKKVVDGLDAQDLIAIIFIIGGFILMLLHIDTVVAGLLTLIAGFYFGKKARQ